MKVFYHNDLDGRCSAFLVRHFRNWGKHEADCDPVELIEIDHDVLFPLDIIQVEEEVWLLDYSVEPEVMMQLRDITGHILWIDHHASAIDKYKEHWRCGMIDGVRKVGQAACILTYKFCSEIFTGKRPRSVPMFVKLISDRDVWKWRHGLRTLHFFRGLSAEDTSPISDIWYEVWRSTHTMEKNGLVIERAFSQYFKDVIQSCGFEVEFMGYRCFVLNGEMRGSDYLERFKPGYDIWIAFRYANGVWSISLYSTTVDVSEIAKQFIFMGKRGGGHRNAAGFITTHPPFLPITTEKIAYRVTSEGLLEPISEGT